MSGEGGLAGRARARRMQEKPTGEFDLATVKSNVLKELMKEKDLPGQFKKFFSSPLYDSVLSTAMLYFASNFQHECLLRALEKAKRQNLDGYNPMAVQDKLESLQEEAAAQRQKLSPIYSEIIMKHSSYKQPHQDRLFFESMYETMVLVLDETFANLKKREVIECELGAIFRTRHFNMSKRKHLPPRSVDTLSVRELYAIKHETTNRALNAKLISSLYDRPTNLGVQAASVTNSVLITSFMANPIVARALTKDPLLRAQLAKNAQDSAKRDSMRRQASRSTSPQRGSQMRSPGSRPNLTVQLPPVNHPNAGGPMTVSAAAPQTTTAAGAATPHALPPVGGEEGDGMLYDDNINALEQIKRRLVYGPGDDEQSSLPSGTGGVGGNVQTRPSVTFT